MGQKYSVFLDDEAVQLLELERREGEPLSRTFARLIKLASQYELVTTVEVKKKDSNGANS